MMQLVCAHCGTTNRVPAARLGDGPVCGRCQGALKPGHPVSLNDGVFEAFVANTELPVLVDCWAAWCGPCQAMAPHFDAASRALPGLVFAKLETDANPRTSQQLRIRAIPTLVLFRGGQELARHSGAMSAADLQRWVQVQLMQ